MRDLVDLHKERLDVLTKRNRCSSATPPSRSNGVGKSVLPYHIAEHARFDHAGKILVARLLTFKVRDYGKSSRPSYRNMKLVQMQVVLCIDSLHRLSLYSISGEELTSLDLELTAGSIITALGYDGEDVNFPTICTADSDGTVRIIGLEFKVSGMVVAGVQVRGRETVTKGLAVPSAVAIPNPPVTPKITAQATVLSKFLLSDTLGAENAPGQQPHAVVLQLRSRMASANRERLLHILDSTGTLHRVNTTGFPKAASLPIFSGSFGKPALQVLAAQSGHVLALASRTGEIALISTSGFALRRMGTCYTGIEGEIHGAAFGSGSINSNTGKFLYVKLDEAFGGTSSVLKFDTKPRKQDSACHLVSVFGEEDQEDQEEMEMEDGNSPKPRDPAARSRERKKSEKSHLENYSAVPTNLLFAHKGYLLTHTTTASGCAVRGFNLTTATTTYGSILGDRVLAPGNGREKCIIDASFPMKLSSSSSSTSGLSAILGGIGGGALSKSLLPPEHSYGHASEDRYLLVAVPVPSTHTTRLIVYANRIPFPPSQADGGFFGADGLLSILKGPALIVVALLFLFKWRTTGSKGLRDGKAGLSLGRGREGGRLTSREMVAREQWQRAQAQGDREGMAAALSSSSAPPIVGGLNQQPVKGDFNAESLSRLYEETQRMRRLQELCPRDLDEN